MKLTEAIERYVHDRRIEGRLTSDASERAYRDCLMVHAEDVGNRDPRYTNRDDVRATLRRWSHPNTYANRLAMLVSFYDWCMEEGVRKDNPARQVKKPRKKKSAVYRMTKDEARSMLLAADTARERRVIYMGICAGLRNQELRGLQGRHLDRPGYVWVSTDIGKGGRERWVPVIPDLEDVIAEAQERCEADEFLVPKQKVWNLDPNRSPEDVKRQPCSGQTIWRIVNKVGYKAGIAAHVHPHLLRHAFGDHVARYAGMREAQFLLGHADISTTETYVGQPTLDELGSAIEGFTFEGPVTNTRSRGGRRGAEAQEYRHGDSNPGSSPARLDMRFPWVDSEASRNTVVNYNGGLA